MQRRPLVARSTCFICIFLPHLSKPLRTMVLGAPLENARHLTQRYDRVRQEAEAHVLRNMTFLKTKDSGGVSLAKHA
ncbi:hypothetical protein YC2023_054581 [Brassica napus]